MNTKTKSRKKTNLYDHKQRNDIPLYPIGIVAEIIGTSNQTLRIYENHGLIKPARKNKNRYYSDNDIRWLTCLRDLIHNKKISIEGIKKLLEYAPCWEVTQCPEDIKTSCSAYKKNVKPCWEYNKMICKQMSTETCRDCVVFLSHAQKKAKQQDSDTGNGGNDHGS